MRKHDFVAELHKVDLHTCLCGNFGKNFHLITSYLWQPILNPGSNISSFMRYI